MTETEYPRPTTKIAVVLRDDLKPWQELNVTAFVISGVAATQIESMGESYEDGSGERYLPMFGQPVMVFSAPPDGLRKSFERALSRNVVPALYTEELFSTSNDRDNRAAVKAVEHDELNLVGFAFRCEKNSADKILKGLSLHP